MAYTEEQLSAIDRLVAEKVMGWKAKPWEHGAQWEMWYDADGNQMDWVADWHPTTDRSQAMMVFEKCHEWMILSWQQDGYEAGEIRGYPDGWYDWFERDTVVMVAICLTAIRKARMEKGEQCRCIDCCFCAGEEQQGEVREGSCSNPLSWHNGEVFCHTWDYGCWTHELRQTGVEVPQ